MPPSRTGIRSSRKRPVSCHFCRSRKLRCSRRFPCPNCTSRGILCELYASQPAESQPENTADDNGVNNLDVLARLQRLEDIVLGKGNDISPAQPVSERPPAQSQSPRREQHATEDARWLEAECSIQGLSSTIAPDGVVFRTRGIGQIQSATSTLTQGSADIVSSEDSTKCFWIPLYEESKYLVEKYLEKLTYLLHVIHVPSVRVTIERLYETLHMQMKPKPSHIALLLSIIASTLYSWTAGDSGTLLSLTTEEVKGRTLVFLKAALDLLEYSSRISDNSLEEAQARIITSSVVCNLEGVSSRYRNLILTAITGARELRLHRLDQSDGPDAPSKSSDTVRAETGRRVWWYLVTTDWVLSHYEGPLKGTYTVHPRQIFVRKPRNLDDIDLLPGKDIVERPIDYPTDVSYTLQRIRLGEICRELTDSTPLFSCEPLTYESVLANDKKTDNYISGFPPFFRLNGGSLEDLTKINPNITPGIIVQRYILNSLTHAHKCRLHLPYFARGSVNPKYTHSREVCLKAARTVIRTERLFEKESISFFPNRFRMAGSVHCLCMAIIVFVLDVCLYKDEGLEEERKKEAADACSILQSAKNDSSIAGRLLQSFMRVIKKHKVSISGIANTDEEGTVPSFNPQPDVLDAAGSGISESDLSLGNEIDCLAKQSFLSPQSSYWNGISETFHTGMESIDWNALFFELDAQSLEPESLL